MPRIIVHLLDSTEGHPLQTWTFEEQDNISIGRSPENDIVLTDPYVSRSHAYLQYVDMGWRLISISRQQLFYQGWAQKELDIIDGLVCRLGSHGSCLRFDQSSKRAASQTIEFDNTLTPMIVLDRKKLDHEVNQIARGDYFENLKDAARRLRESSEK